MIDRRLINVVLTPHVTTSWLLPRVESDALLPM
jgi:hypothetical protein